MSRGSVTCVQTGADCAKTAEPIVMPFEGQIGYLWARTVQGSMQGQCTAPPDKYTERPAHGSQWRITH